MTNEELCKEYRVLYKNGYTISNYHRAALKAGLILQEYVKITSKSRPKPQENLHEHMWIVVKTGTCDATILDGMDEDETYKLESQTCRRYELFES